MPHLGNSQEHLDNKNTSRMRLLNSLVFVPTKNVFVEGTSEVDSEQLPMKESHTNDSTGKSKVAQMVRINVRITIWLKCSSWSRAKQKSNNVPDTACCTVLTIRRGSEQTIVCIENLLGQKIIELPLDTSTLGYKYNSVVTMSRNR